MQDSDAGGPIRNLSVEEVARSHLSVLRRSRFELRRRDGSWQEQVRETYDRGNGCAILLRDPARDMVLLVRQFRFPAWANPGPADAAGRGYLIEVVAGLVEGRDPAEAVRAEAAEEAGVTVGAARLVMDCYMSPGSVTERVSLFIANYTARDRTGAGGGLIEEGEDIGLIEIGFDDALAMVADGRIADAKTVILLYRAALERSQGLQHDFGQAAVDHAEAGGGASAEVDHAAGRAGAVVDGDHDRLRGIDEGDAHQRAERQGRVGGGEAVLVEVLAVAGSVALPAAAAVPTRDAGLDGRSINGELPAIGGFGEDSRGSVVVVAAGAGGGCRQGEGR